MSLFKPYKSHFTIPLICYLKHYILLTDIFHQSAHFQIFCTGRVKIHQIMSFFKQVSFSSKFGSLFIVMRDNPSALFQLKLYILYINKSSTLKCKFLDLLLLILKFTKFIMSFLEPRASFSSNFASLNSIMRDNFSVLFHLKLYMLSKKRTHQSANYWTFNCLYGN